jgi:hypothetical protein
MIGNAIEHDNDTRIENYDSEHKEKSRVGLETTRLTGLCRIMSAERWKRKIAEINRSYQTANPDGHFGEIEAGATLHDLAHKPVTIESYEFSKDLPISKQCNNRYDSAQYSVLAIDRESR